MNKNQEWYDDDLLLKMARNHLTLFEKVTPPDFLHYLSLVRENTMLSIERLYDLYLTIKYLNDARIEGALLEVGVWRGGALGMCLLSDQTKKRQVFGFDTFEGHSAPDADEYDIRGQNMRERWENSKAKNLTWAAADINECNSFLEILDNSPSKRFKLIKGDIKTTGEFFPNTKLALVRVDCDWYPESLYTLKRFWPMIVKGGFLILDDYGHHTGQRKAAEEFFSFPVKLTHLDYSCVVIQKLQN
jgi:hypothetical protein